MTEINGKKYMSTKEAAEKMGVTYSTLNNWRQRAKNNPEGYEGPKYIRIAGRILYEEAAVDHYLMSIGA